MIRRFLLVCLLAGVFAGAAKPAHADHDVVQLGNTIHVAQDTSIHDAVCFFCNVDDEGEVEGDIVVFFGNVHIARKADHDIVDFFGTISGDDNASIGHDMVSMFGSIHLGRNVSVGQDMVAMFGEVRDAGTTTVGGNRVWQPVWIFWGPLLIFGLVIIVVVREIRAQRRRRYMQYPFPPRP